MSRPVGSKNKKKVYIPTDEVRKDVCVLVANGTPQAVIARLTGLTTRQCEKAFKEELQHGKQMALAGVAQSIFHKATVEKNVTAQMFILSRKGGWQEVKVTEITGHDGDAIRVETMSSTDRLQRVGWIMTEALKREKEEAEQKQIAQHREEFN